MRVYAESNFVLELVLEQEQHRACEELMLMASSRSIELAVPALALLEPYQTIGRNRRERNSLRHSLDNSFGQLRRTASMAAEAAKLQAASDALLQASQAASQRYTDITADIRREARILTQGAEDFASAENLQQEYGLELPDALMLASVLADATARPSECIFVNRNSRDFDDPDIIARLREVQCDALFSFDGCTARLRARLT